MRKSIVLLVSGALITGYVAYPGVHHAVDDHQVHDSKQSLGTAFGYLVASPILILAGLSQGIATASYLEIADLHEMDREMRRGGTDVSLDATYRHAYGRLLEGVPKSGATGRVFRHMEGATRHFQRVLTGYGVASPERYVLTAIRAADRDGYTLYALVERCGREQSASVIPLAASASSIPVSGPITGLGNTTPKATRWTS